MHDMQRALTTIADVLDQILQNSMNVAPSNAFSTIIHCALPWLLTLAIMLSLWRVPESVYTSGVFPLGGLAASTHIGVDHGCFVEPVNFSLLCFGLFLNLWVLLIEPLLNHFGALLVCFF